jgi:hypothetical protein
MRLQRQYDMGSHLRMIRTARVRSVVPSFRKPPFENAKGGAASVGKTARGEKSKVGQPPKRMSFRTRAQRG